MTDPLLKNSIQETEQILPSSNDSNHPDRPVINGTERIISQTFKSDPTLGIELLYREYYTSLYSHAFRIVYSQDVAKDIVSDVFCHFYQQAIYLRVETSYKSYLYRSVRNACLKYLKKHTGLHLEIPEYIIETYADSQSDSPEHLLVYTELSNTIDQVIIGLPKLSRRIFLMSRHDGMKYQEIADELNLSIKTIEAHISKTLVKLRKVLRN